MSRRHGTYLLAVLLVAVLFRAFYSYLVWTPVAKSPEDSMAVMYLRSSYLMAAGLGYAQTIPGSPAYRDIERIRERADQQPVTPAMVDDISPDGLYPEMLHPPGWSILAYSIHRLTGLPVPVPMQVVGTVVDVASCALLYALVVMVLGSHGVALVASLLYALFPPFAYSVASLSPVVFTTFFVIAATIFFLLGVKAEGRRRYLFYGLCGLVMGVGSYFRPDYLLLGPFLIAGLWIHRRRFWRPVAVGAFILMVTLATLWPWAYRNYRHSGQWVFTSSSVGATLVTGLGTFPNPWGFGSSDLDRTEEAAAQGISTPFGLEADRYFRRVFVDAVKEHPGAYARILLQRSWQPVATPYNWGLTLPSRATSFSEIRREGRLVESIGYLVRAFWPAAVSAGIAFLSLIASLFMVLREWKRHPLVLFLILVPLYAALSHIFTHMAPYFLLPGFFAQLVGLAYVLVTVRRRRGAEGRLPETAS